MFQMNDMTKGLIVALNERNTMGHRYAQTDRP